MNSNTAAREAAWLGRAGVGRASAGASAGASGDANARAVIFDLYGTLVDIQVDEAGPRFWRELAADLYPGRHAITGGVLARAYRRLIGEEAARRADGFLLDTVFARLLARFGPDPTPENLSRFGAAFRRHSILHLAKKDYTDKLLSALKAAGYRVGLASNTEALLTAYDLTHLDLADRFDALVLSSAAGVAKPDPRIFELIAARLGVAAGNAVFLGDSFENDVQGAVNAHMRAIWLTTEPDAAPDAAARCDAEATGRATCAGFSLGEITAALARLGFEV